MKIWIPKNRHDLKAHLHDPLFKNAIYLISTTVATSLFGFIFWMIAARYYTSEEVGLGSTIISAMSLLSMLSLLGFNVALIRFLPTSNLKMDMINSCFTLSLAASAVITIIFLLGLGVFSPKLLFLRSNLLFALLFITFTCVWSITTLLNSILTAERTAKYVLLKESIFGASRLPIPIFLVSLGAFGIFVSWGIGSVIALITGLIFLFHVIPAYRPAIRVDGEIISEMLHFSFWSYISNLFNVSPALILPIMITNILTPDLTAYFYIAWMIANLLFMIPRQTAQSLFAEGSNFDKRLGVNLKKSLKFISLLLIPSLLFILIFGDRLLLLFGSEYSEEGFGLLQILALSTIPLALNTVYVTVKNIKKQVKTVTLIYGVIAVGTLGGSYLLLGSMGLVGIGYAWVMGNGVVAGGIGLVAAKDRLKSKPILK